MSIRPPGNSSLSVASLRELLLETRPFDAEPSILLLDGGVSTHLQDKIAPHSFRYRELWSSSLLLDEAGRQLIQKGHEDWLRSGCNVVSTVTYQCHYEPDLWPLNEDGSPVLNAACVDQMFRDAVRLARQAQQSAAMKSNGANCGIPTFVAVSLGCYGSALANGAEYTGDYGERSVDDLLEFHRLRFTRALGCKPDAIAFETVPSYRECLAIERLLTQGEWLTEGSRNVACWISLACRNDRELNDGSSVEDALNALSNVPATVLQGIGFNCCSVERLSGLVAILIHHMAQPNVPKRAIVLYPNTGEAWDAEAETWTPGTGLTEVDEFCDIMMEVVEQIQGLWPANAEHKPTIVIGGCCRTSPAAIEELRRRNMSSKESPR